MDAVGLYDRRIHAATCVKTAIEMLQFLEQKNSTIIELEDACWYPQWSSWGGIGRKNFSFDLWGDTL